MKDDPSLRVEQSSEPNIASPTAVRGEAWQTIDTAPMNVEVLMAWHVTWPHELWKMEAGLYGSTKGGWNHGNATHWKPLPAPPALLTTRAEVGEEFVQKIAPLAKRDLA